MSDYLQGLVSYPGIQKWETFQMTDVSGISPAIGIMTVFPQFGLPAANGDIVLTYDDYEITFKDCHIDSASYERNSGGQIVSVRFLDERWKWAFYEITGRYNIRKPNNFVDPDHEKTPRELATLCFEAMNVSEFNVDALPNDARPDVDWDHANPAQELARLCDDLGCRIVPKRSTGEWFIRVTGDGADLPNQYPYNDAGDGFDPKERPDFIKIVTAPKRFQIALRLQPMGKETDLSWKWPGNLSYRNENDLSPAFYGFGRDHEQQSNVDPNRVTQPDGTKISPQELALQTIFRTFRICGLSRASGQPDGFDSEKIRVNGYKDADGNETATRKQLILSDQLVQVWTDEVGAEHTRPAFVAGEFYGEKCDGPTGNYPPATRIDYQGQVYRDSEEERASFSLSLDPIDTDRSFLTFSKPMVFQDATNSVFTYAKIFLTCAVEVRDPDTWQPVRHEYLKQIGDGSNRDFCYEAVKEEIQPWWITTYSADFSSTTGTTDNQDEVQRQCEYYADSIAKTFENVSTSTRTYLGLFPIDMDGAIQQVSYRIGKQGADTIASKGTEHDFDIPQYAERRQRDGRKNQEERMKLLKEISERKLALRGTFNT